MNSLKKRLFISCACFVVFVAIFFRFYKFTTNPPSLNWDEVALGYNAYSILKTGKDEFGYPFPLYFRSLDDYKLPVYGYLTVGSIALFGYNDFAVRFPSAFAGTLTVIIAGFLAYKLTGSKRIGLLTSAVMAILPWNIQFSRMAAEANVGLMFLILGATAFLFGLRRRHWLLVISIIGFILATYSYLSYRVVAPLLGLTLIVVYRHALILVPKRMKIFLSILLGAFIIFFLWDMYSHTLHLRIKGTDVLMSEYADNIFKKKEQEMYVDAAKGINIPRRIFHDNKLITTMDIYLRGYITHFSPTFLFFDYDQKQHHTPFVGLIYFWMLPFIVAGAYFFVRNTQRRECIFIFMWFIIAPIPASVTLDIPHAIRAYAIVIPIVIMSASGMVIVYNSLRDRKKRTALAAGVFILCGVSSYYYFHQYMIHLPVERSKDWVYGRKEMTEYLMKNKNSYDRIIISTALEWPYIFMLYYSKYDPAAYLKQGGTKSGGWGEEGNTYDTFEFHRLSLNNSGNGRVLFVGLPKEFSPGIDPLYRINYLDGTPAIYIAEGNIRIP